MNNTLLDITKGLFPADFINRYYIVENINSASNILHYDDQENIAVINLSLYFKKAFGHIEWLLEVFGYNFSIVEIS